MATFVLVPGAWHGSWAFEAVIPLLERAGHTVHALTLTGLRPDDGDATVASANLDTHAHDVVNLLDRARLQADRGWRVHDIPTAHNAMREAPSAVAELLI
jgi:hypothetical protein